MEKQIKRNGQWPRHSWGYGPLAERQALTVREHSDGLVKITVGGVSSVLPPAEAQERLREILRTANLRTPDPVTYQLLIDCGLVERARPQRRQRVEMPPREERVGFSEIAAVMGLSPFTTPLQLWRQKRGLEPPVEQTFAMRWGTMAERLVIQLAVENMPVPVRRVKYQPELVDLPLAGHGDALLTLEDGRRVLVEAKVVSNLRAHDAYRLQLNAQLGAARLEVGYLATVVNNWHFELEEVLFDPALYARQRAAAEEFLRRVREDRPPLPEEYVAPESVDGVLVVPAGSPTAQRLERMAELLRTLEPLEKELSQLREQLKEEMDTAGCMKVRSESVEATLKVSERESLDTKALKAAHPDVVAPFVRVSTVKTLQLKIL